MFEAERSRSPGLPIGNIPALMTQIQILTINSPRHLGILLKRPYTDRAKSIENAAQSQEISNIHRNDR
jgi:hypothetical protein